jgi:broad specificity phosphatase PhoE
VACTFITHPEVVVDPGVPVTAWSLSEVGRDRATRLPGQLRDVPRAVACSAERKAVETATILAAALDLQMTVDPGLGEMDRTSTGYLPPGEFEQTADAFFAQPELSVRGWERAIDAQHRIVSAIRGHLCVGPDPAIAFVAHGGVGALLMASLMSVPISRALDQPGLGSCFRFDAGTWTLLSPWERIR